MPQYKRQSPEERKSQILTAAEQVLTEVGLDSFTVDKVVTKAGIAKGTVYKYYKSKDEVFSEISVKALKKLLEVFKAGAEEKESVVDKLKSVPLSYYQYSLDYPAYHELLEYMERPEFTVMHGDFMKVSHALQNFTLDMFKAGQENGELKPHLNPIISTNVMWASCLGVVQFVESKGKLLLNREQISQQEIVTEFSEILIEGMKK
jgi:AcrR family transcriptional regulator